MCILRKKYYMGDWLFDFYLNLSPKGVEVGESITDFGHRASRRGMFSHLKIFMIIFHEIISHTKAKEDVVPLFFYLFIYFAQIKKEKKTGKEDESPARIATSGRMLIWKFF